MGPLGCRDPMSQKRQWMGMKRVDSTRYWVFPDSTHKRPAWLDDPSLLPKKPPKKPVNGEDDSDKPAKET